MDNRATILVLGAPSAGKTVYGAQLLGRLQANLGQLQLRGAIPSIAPFEAARQRLAQGLTVDHTPTGTTDAITLPLYLPGGPSLDLIWPEYAGEQLATPLRERRVEPSWRERVAASVGWLLLIHAESVQPPEDLLTRPAVASDSVSAPTVGSDWAWSDQSTFIELLQILRFVGGHGSAMRLSHPRLALLLSRWDELSKPLASQPPSAVLHERLPLVSDFVSSLWEPTAVQVYGLSAQGRALRADRPNGSYLDRGPEQHGYVVLPDGTRSDDLGVPIHWLVEHER